MSDSWEARRGEMEGCLRKVIRNLGGMHGGVASEIEREIASIVLGIMQDHDTGDESKIRPPPGFLHLVAALNAAYLYYAADVWSPNDQREFETALMAVYGAPVTKHWPASSRVLADACREALIQSEIARQAAAEKPTGRRFIHD